MTKVLLVKVISLFHWLRLEKTDVLVSDSFSPGKHILSLPSCYDRQIELNTTPLASSSDLASSQAHHSIASVRISQGLGTIVEKLYPLVLLLYTDHRAESTS